jgi:hypothetical protein
MKNSAKRLLTAFLFFMSFPLFAQQEIGRLTFEIKATNERVTGSDRFWYYVTIVSTLPDSITSAKANLDNIATYISDYEGGYTKRTPNGIELKATYRDSISLLNWWMHLTGLREDSNRYLVFQQTVFKGEPPVIYEVTYHIVTNHNLNARLLSDHYEIFDYEYTDPVYFRNKGYRRYFAEYAFYR